MSRALLLARFVGRSCRSLPPLQLRAHSSSNREFRESSESTTSWEITYSRRGRRDRRIKVHGSSTEGWSLEQHYQSAGELDASALRARRGTLSSAYSKVRSVLQATFLPAGYPATVAPGYLGYVAWQAFSNLCSSATTVLASTFLLYSVGLGAGAIPTAGALNWVLKDGLGQLGTLLFGKAIAHNFDIHSKSWFFLSMLKLQVASGLEILTILAPQHFLVLGTLANSIKGLAWMANSSTRSVFNLAFAKDNNIADITAKGTSQYICANMFGTVMGASICGVIGQDAGAAALCFGALATATLAGSYATVKTIPLATLNNTRLQLLCELYLSAISTAAAHRHQLHAARMAAATGGLSRSHAGNGSSGGSSLGSVAAGEAAAATAAAAGMGLRGGISGFERTYDEELSLPVPGPAALAAEDPPLPWLLGDPRLLDPAIIVGGMDKLLDGAPPELLVVLLSTYRLSRTIVAPRGPTAVHVVLHTSANARDIVTAYLQACLLRRRMRDDAGLGIAAAEHAAALVQAQRAAAAAEARAKAEAAERLAAAREAAAAAKAGPPPPIPVAVAPVDAHAEGSAYDGGGGGGGGAWGGPPAPGSPGSRAEAGDAAESAHVLGAAEVLEGGGAAGQQRTGATSQEGGRAAGNAEGQQGGGAMSWEEAQALVAAEAEHEVQEEGERRHEAASIRRRHRQEAGALEAERLPGVSPSQASVVPPVVPLPRDAAAKASSKGAAAQAQGTAGRGSGSSNSGSGSGHTSRLAEGSAGSGGHSGSGGTSTSGSSSRNGSSTRKSSSDASFSSSSASAASGKKPLIRIPGQLESPPIPKPPSAGAQPAGAGPQHVPPVSITSLAELRIVLQDTLLTAERLTSPFMRSLEAAGWRVERIVVEAHKQRANW